MPWRRDTVANGYRSGLILAEIGDREPQIPPAGGLGGPFQPPMALNLITFKTPSKTAINLGSLWGMG